MHSVGIETLKIRLGECVRAAAAGETVLVADRGPVLAEVVSPRVRGDASPDEQRLGELIRQDLLTSARLSVEARLPRPKPLSKVSDLLRELDDSRADR